MLFNENSNVWIDCMSVFFLSINFDQQRLQLPINVFLKKLMCCEFHIFNLKNMTTSTHRKVFFVKNIALICQIWDFLKKIPKLLI